MTEIFYTIEFREKGLLNDLCFRFASTPRKELSDDPFSNLSTIERRSRFPQSLTSQKVLGDDVDIDIEKMPNIGKYRTRI